MGTLRGIDGTKLRRMVGEALDGLEDEQRAAIAQAGEQTAGHATEVRRQRRRHAERAGKRRRSAEFGSALEADERADAHRRMSEPALLYIARAHLPPPHVSTQMFGRTGQSVWTLSSDRAERR
ncbi:hypothetical protein BH24CHL6_BH24CHL6_15390 [soil metagenome]